MTRAACRLRLAAVLAGLCLLVGPGNPVLGATLTDRVGVNSAVNPNVFGAWPGTSQRRLVIGQDVVYNERISTEAQGQTQILFVDQSTLSIGPNANMVIDKFVFDPNAGTGEMAASLARGVFRFVGGRISKGENAVTMRTPAATIGIRGGVFLARVRDCGGAAGCKALQAIFVYGKGLVVTGQNGVSQTVFRPGWQITVDQPGMSPSDPAPAPAGAITEMLAQLDGQAGGNGGAPVVPTDAAVAQSGIANSISSSVGATEGGLAAEVPNTSRALPPTTYQNTAASGPLPQNTPPATEIQPVVVTAPVVTVAPVVPITPFVNPVPTIGTTPAGGGTPGLGGTPVAAGGNQQNSQNNQQSNQQNSGNAQPSQSASTQQVNQTSSGPTTPTGTGTMTGGNTGGEQGGGGTVGGGGTGGSSVVITAISGNIRPIAAMGGLSHDTGYVHGTITYPSATSLQDGAFSVTLPGGARFTLSGLTAGSTVPVIATLPQSLGGGSASGTARTSNDGSFFYADLTNSGGSWSIFGGVAATQTALAGNPARQVTSFGVTPIASSQTIPFLPAANGGTIPNATVSPLYLTTAANQKFAAPGATPPTFLQASLAVNGQGAGQQSALAVTAGQFTTTLSGNAAATGSLVGTVFPSATAAPVNIRSAVTTTADLNGNTLFGGGQVGQFVVDQNQVVAGVATPSSATATSSGTPPYSYGFNQPAIATTAAPMTGSVESLNPSGTPNGNFAGILVSRVGESSTARVLSGTATVTSDAVANTVGATFSGSNPFAIPGPLNSSNLQFGTAATGGAAPSSFANSQVYGALGNNSVTTSTTLGTASTSNPQLAMVTSGAIPNGSSWMPQGVTPCDCQYLQWGYWTGQVAASGSGDPAATAAVNTWVAGKPTVNLPTMGQGTYSGAAVGTVFNSGATYLAAGGFNASYDFGQRTGMVNISNFDGANYTAAVKPGVTCAGAYCGDLSGTRQFGTAGPEILHGPLVGNFYGPGAVETGGGFDLQAIRHAYLASGIFAGKQQ